MTDHIPDATKKIYPKRHRAWYHKKSGKGRTRREVKVLIKDLVKSIDAKHQMFSCSMKYGEVLGMITALKWVLNWTELDNNFNEQENINVESQDTGRIDGPIDGIVKGAASSE